MLGAEERVCLYLSILDQICYLLYQDRNELASECRIVAYLIYY